MTNGLTGFRYTVLIIIIFYCYQEEECRSLYRELRCYRNSLWRSHYVSNGYKYADCVVSMRFGPFYFLEISMHLRV